MNRRDFVRGSVLACAGASLAPPALAKSGRRIVFRLENGDGGGILRSFLFGDDENEMDNLALPPTGRLLEHPSHPVLFALLDVDSWQFRPRGAVCSVHYDEITGKFLSHNMTPLSLGAIGVVVAGLDASSECLTIATSTGIRNIFQLTEHGDIGELISVRKAISPHSVQSTIRI